MPAHHGAKGGKMKNAQGLGTWKGRFHGWLPMVHGQTVVNCRYPMLNMVAIFLASVPPTKRLVINVVCTCARLACVDTFRKKPTGPPAGTFRPSDILPHMGSKEAKSARGSGQAGEDSCPGPWSETTATPPPISHHTGGVGWWF